MGNEVTGTINATLEGVTMGQAIVGSGSLVAAASTIGAHGASPTSLFRTAQDFLKAANTLDPGVTTGPFGFVAAQCLELALKAYLMKNAGMTEADLIKRIGHDLQKAWTQCVQNGLGIEATMPVWAALLDGGHDRPYLFRYAQENTGLVLAPKITALDGLQGVLAAVQAATGIV
jgi:hypothetical protein